MSLVPMSPMSQREIGRTANALRWVPDRLKRAIIGTTARQLVENFRLGMTAMMLDKHGNQSTVPDLSMRLGWSTLLAKVMGMLGPESQIIVQRNASLGVKDEAELRELVEAGREFKRNTTNATLTCAQYHAEALELLLECEAREPELRASTDARRRAPHCSGCAGPCSKCSPDGR